jgi:hypothetical protein
MQIGRWLDAAAAHQKELGIPVTPTAVTETTAFKFDGDYWPSHLVVGTHAHALVYAWNWMTLLADPRCTTAVLHDLESPWFGIMRYDVGYDEKGGHFTWLPTRNRDRQLRRFPNQYVLSPTCAANKLLSELVECRVALATVQPADPSIRAIWGTDNSGRDLLVVVHRSPDRKRLSLAGRAAASAQSLTADALGSSLPEQYRVSALTVDQARPDQLELPPWSVTLVRLR